MTQDWKWYAGSSDYMFEAGPFDTREECIEEARGMGVEDYDGGIHIVEAYKNPVPLSSMFDVDLFLERADDNTYDLMGEDGGALFSEGVTSEQVQDLQNSVQQAIAQWQERHDLEFHPWCFNGSRNHDYILEEGAVT